MSPVDHCKLAMASDTRSLEGLHLPSLAIGVFGHRTLTINDRSPRGRKIRAVFRLYRYSSARSGVPYCGLPVSVCCAICRGIFDNVSSLIAYTYMLLGRERVSSGE